MIKSIFHGATGSSDLIEPSWPELPCGWEVFGVTGPTGITYAQDIGTTAGGYSPLHVGTSFMLGWTGDQPPAGTTYSVSYAVSPGVLIHGTDFVKAAVTAALRVAFTNQRLYRAYIYNPDDTLSTMGIHQSFPKAPFKNPGLVISIGPADMDRTTLNGRDLLTEEKVDGVPVSYFAWGSVPMQVNIDIVAITDTDRRKLTDITAHFVRHLFAWQLAKFGIGYKSVHINGEKDEEWQGQLLYLNTITIPVYTEWQVHYPIALVDVIGNIDITDIQAEL